MSKNLSVSELCDVYGSLLTAKQREMVTAYYDYDLSIAEIAQNCEISRQAAFDAVNKATASLNDYENKLHLHEIYSMVKRMEECATLDEAKDFAKTILNFLEQ